MVRGRRVITHAKYRRMEGHMYWTKEGGGCHIHWTRRAKVIIQTGLRQAEITHKQDKGGWRVITHRTKEGRGQYKNWYKQGGGHHTLYSGM